MPGTVQEQKTPWVYKAQPWDSPELHQLQSTRTEPGVAGDDFEATILCRDEDDNLQRQTVRFKFGDKSITIGETLIPNSSVRYITTKVGELATTSNVLLLSYRHDYKIKSYFIHEPDPAMAEKILNKFRLMQYREVLDLPDSRLKEPIYDFFLPKLVCVVEVEVSKSNSEGEKKNYILTLDEECFCLFSKQYQSEPDYQVNYWKDAGQHVVDKVAVLNQTNRLVIETETFQYSMDAGSPVVKELIVKMRTVNPKPKSCLTDLAETVRFLQGRPMKTEETKPTDSLPVQDGEATVMCIRDTETAISESARQFYRSFKDNLEAAYAEGEKNRDWQDMWAPHDENLRQVLELNLAENRDARSGGLDPDDISHFQSSLADIDDKLFSQDFVGAVSTLFVVREVFSQSSYTEIRPILADDDYTLLKKLFFKILKDPSIN